MPQVSDLSWILFSAKFVTFFFMLNLLITGVMVFNQKFNSSFYSLNLYKFSFLI